jgi:hypothetical protein
MFNCHFNTKETLKKDGITPLGDVLALEQVFGEGEGGRWGSLSLLIMC